MQYLSSTAAVDYGTQYAYNNKYALVCVDARMYVDMYAVFFRVLDGNVLQALATV